MESSDLSSKRPFSCDLMDTKKTSKTFCVEKSHFDNLKNLSQQEKDC